MSTEPELPTAARAILRALLGGRPEIRIQGSRFRLSLETAFRLEEVDGEFVYYLRNAGAVGRRLDGLAGSAEIGWVEAPPRWGERQPTN